jgi:hypothetical protein
MGLLGAAFGLGFVLGPVLGGLAGSFGYAAVPAACFDARHNLLGLTFRSTVIHDYPRAFRSEPF